MQDHRVNCLFSLYTHMHKQTQRKRNRPLLYLYYMVQNKSHGQQYIQWKIPHQVRYNFINPDGNS